MTYSRAEKAYFEDKPSSLGALNQRGDGRSI
jgi:hypothetical protein